MPRAGQPHGDPRLKSAARRACVRAVRARGGDCIRCHRPIDPRLRWPHPGSWTADEAVPRSAGGDPCDPANVWPAHLRCNTRHGAELTNRRRAHRPDQPGGPDLVLDDW